MVCVLVSSIHFWQLRDQSPRLRTDITVLIFSRQMLQHNANATVRTHWHQKA
jgi:hypothetical protein